MSDRALLFSASGMFCYCRTTLPNLAGPAALSYNMSHRPRAAHSLRPPAPGPVLGILGTQIKSPFPPFLFPLVCNSVAWIWKCRGLRQVILPRLLHFPRLHFNRPISMIIVTCDLLVPPPNVSSDRRLSLSLWLLNAHDLIAYFIF